jgi:GDPmannose 4,6-dehydratase
LLKNILDRGFQSVSCSCGLYACTDIFFNHESPLRPERFVTQKIVAGASKIKAGLIQKNPVQPVAITKSPASFFYIMSYIASTYSGAQPQSRQISKLPSRIARLFVSRAFEHFDLD